MDVPDKNCITLGDGSCIGVNCMHDVKSDAINIHAILRRAEDLFYLNKPKAAVDLLKLAMRKDRFRIEKEERFIKLANRWFDEIVRITDQKVKRPC